MNASVPRGSRRNMAASKQPRGDQKACKSHKAGTPLPWLQYTDDEVVRFHPIFEVCGAEALRLEGLDAELDWKHHVRTPGTRLIPDFVLEKRTNGRWLC